MSHQIIRTREDLVALDPDTIQDDKLGPWTARRIGKENE